MDNAVKHLLEDYVTDLYEKAKEAKDMCRHGIPNETVEPAHEFNCGRALAYYEVLASLTNRARVFGIYDEISSLQQIDLRRLVE